LWHTLRTGRAPIARVTLTQELFVKVLGLPFSSLIVLLVVPLGLIAYQYFVCWQIKTGRRE
jgi:uncharacterized membrane protein